MARSKNSKSGKHLNTLKREKLSVMMTERARKQRALLAEAEGRKIVPCAVANGKNWREYVMHLNNESAASKANAMRI